MAGWPAARWGSVRPQCPPGARGGKNRRQRGEARRYLGDFQPISRTVLVGCDLRKPKIYNDFGLKNEKGVSTWLIGENDIDSIVQDTSYKNLSIILAGPIPPNPSELIALGKIEELFKILKSRYDYVIIDSSPIGVVSDYYTICHVNF